MIEMKIDEMKKDIDNVMDDAYKIGNANSSVATAYFLEAIAKMMYFNTFHTVFEKDQEDIAPEVVEDELSESTDI